MTDPLLRQLKALVVLNALLVILLIAFAAGAALLGSRLFAREQAMEERMAAGARVAAEQVREFTARRAALEPIASGPVGKLEQQVKLMQLMSDEQVALLQQAGGVRADVGRASKPAPQARRPSSRQKR